MSRIILVELSLVSGIEFMKFWVDGFESKSECGYVLYGVLRL
jgi:hypothetical protein